MANVISELAVRISANLDPLRKGLRQVRDETARTGKEISRAFARGREKAPGIMASAAERLGTAFAAAVNPITLAAGAVAGVSAGLVSSTRSAAEFQREFSNVASLGANSAEQLELLRQGLLNLAPAVGEGPTALTEALYDVVSAGYAGQDAMQVLDASAKAAKAGLTSTKTAADLVTTALNAYGLSGEHATEITDQVQTAVKLGKTTWDEMATALGRVIPTAASVGISFGEVSAAVAAMTSQGIKTSEAITGLKAALSNIISPSKEAVDTAKALGIEFDAAALRSKGLAGLLDDVRRATGGNTEEMANLFGSVEALNAVLALTSESGGKKFLEAAQAMQESSGATEEAFRTQAQTYDQTAKRFGAAVEAIKIQLGTVLLPVLTALLDWFTRSISAIQDWATQVRGLFAGVGDTGREQASALQSVFSGMGDVLRAVFDVLAAAWESVLKPAWNEIAPVVQRIAGIMTDVLGGALQGVAHVLKALAALLRGDFSGAWGEMQQAVIAVVQGLVQGMNDAFGGLVRALQRVWDGITGGIKHALNYAVSIVNKFISMLNTISINIPSVNVPGLGTVGGGRIGFNIPTIPALAEGGIVKKPTLALIGEAGPEAVVPLSKGGGGASGAAAGSVAALQQLAGAIGSVVSALNPFAAILNAINPVATIIQGMLTQLQPVLEPIISLLTEVGATLGKLIAPLLAALTPVLRILVRVFEFAAKIVAGIWNAIATAINAILGWLGVHLELIDLETDAVKKKEQERAQQPAQEQPQQPQAPSNAISYDLPVVQINGSPLWIQLLESAADKMLEAADKMLEAAGGNSADTAGGVSALDWELRRAGAV